MLEMRLEIVAKYRGIVDKTFGICFVNFEEPIHVFLHVCWRIDVSHRRNTKHLLASMRDNRNFPTVFKFDVSLIIGLL